MSMDEFMAGIGIGIVLGYWLRDGILPWVARVMAARGWQ